MPSAAGGKRQSRLSLSGDRVARSEADEELEFRPLRGNLGAVPAATGAGNALTHHETFQYTGAKQTFTVPDGVTVIKVAALGGNGGDWKDQVGGYGGRVSATLSVTPLEPLIVYVGGNASGATGGFNGGGSGGAGPIYSGSGGAGGGGGGGASDVRTGSGKLSDRILVAAGGGGGGGSSYVKPTATGVRMWKGWKAVRRVIVFYW